MVSEVWSGHGWMTAQVYLYMHFLNVLDKIMLIARSKVAGIASAAHGRCIDSYSSCYFSWR